MTAPRPNLASEPAVSIALLTFKEAAAHLHDKVTESALHAARKAGDLWAKKIGKRYFTTHAALMEYLQCPDTESPPASTGEPMKNNGSSVTAASRSGQDMALASVARLKQRSHITSQVESRPNAEARHIRGS